MGPFFGTFFYSLHYIVWTASPCHSIDTYDKRGLCLNPLYILRHGFSLGNWPGYLFAAKGGLYTSLLMATYVCLIYGLYTSYLSPMGGLFPSVLT